ncbi:hypothetical protein LOTGIDRAFT_204097 [Lottia gigantea]|uniref:Arginase n=1 Tax=Lottia gigantea TaxID=225164 RepID=V4BSQ3_LOTGI|nr:hypothetical protein LOTGIDRAFT_204097 [Lottia gigantea]ESO92074.1 hypothetical protein LOTGIDRAFT_204097 [Lottia gigantea]
MPFITENKKVGLLGIPFSKGQPRGGTEQGPQAIREAGIVEKLEQLGTQVCDHGDLTFDYIENDTPDGNVKNPRTVGHANKKISKAVSDIIYNGQLCLNLGGDHSMAMGTIHGHAQVEPDLVVVWVDAHADINTPLTSPSGNIHGMPLSFIVKELDGYVPTVKGFEWVKPCLSVKDLVYIGLRDVDPGERWIIEKFGIKAFSMQEVDKLGIREVMEQALKAIDPSGTRPIHLSFDVDALDPTITPSTGTPVHGGLSFREGQYIMEELANTGRLNCIDVAEVNPSLGNKEENTLTTETTLEVLNKCFGQKRGGGFPSNYVMPRAEKTRTSCSSTKSH